MSLVNRCHRIAVMLASVLSWRTAKKFSSRPTDALATMRTCRSFRSTDAGYCRVDSRATGTKNSVSSRLVLTRSVFQRGFDASYSGTAE